MEMLLGMGFDEAKCKKALAANANVDAALSYIFANDDKPPAWWLQAVPSAAKPPQAARAAGRGAGGATGGAAAAAADGVSPSAAAAAAAVPGGAASNSAADAAAVAAAAAAALPSAESLLARLQQSLKASKEDSTSFGSKMLGWLHNPSLTAKLLSSASALATKDLEEAPPLDSRRKQMYTASRFGDMAGISPYGLPKSVRNPLVGSPSASASFSPCDRGAQIKCSVWLVAVCCSFGR